MRLADAFEIQPGDVVSIIGAGGKTALMIALGYELAEAGYRVLATTTVGLEDHQLELVPRAMPITSSPLEISSALTEDKFVFLYSSIRNSRAAGSDPETIQALLDVIDSDVVLVEADNSDRRLLKAPYDYEPVIPSGTSLVIPVASLSVLGKPLDDEHIYNAAAIRERYGFPEGGAIKAAWLAQILRDETLGMQGVPDRVRVMAFINQTPQKGYGRWRGRVVAQLALRNARMSGVVLGEVRGAQPVYEVQRSVGAVVLAAGQSTRMGDHKILLPWSENRTIIEHIVYQLIKSRIDPIVVVTGHNAKDVKQALKPYDVEIVYNKAYRTGEMLSSLKAGLQALPVHVAAGLVVLGDQPRLQSKVLYQLLTRYATGRHDLIVPSYQERRGHPILIARRHWGEILNMKPGATLRDLLNAHADSIEYVVVDNDSVLRDVDTPQDYREERWRAGL